MSAANEVSPASGGSGGTNSLPEGAWDCHFHILQRPDSAAEGVDKLAALHGAIGIKNGVLVQSNTQDLDDFLAILRAARGRYLGVVSASPRLTGQFMALLADLGVVGVRFAPGKGGALDRDLLARMAEFGWLPHYGLRDCHFESWAQSLPAMGSDFVLEHSGWPVAAEGVGGAAFGQLLKWLGHRPVLGEDHHPALAHAEGSVCRYIGDQFRPRAARPGADSLGIGLALYRLPRAASRTRGTGGLGARGVGRPREYAAGLCDKCPLPFQACKDKGVDCKLLT